MIELARSVYDEIVYQAYDGNEAEVCGILAGEYDAEHTVITDVYPAENAADDPEIRYAIDPEEQLALTEAIEDAGLEVAGFYHSHPAGPTEPSETDAARATWPDFSYVIVALDGYPFVGSWRWREHEDRFEGERVRVASSRGEWVEKRAN
ncbi:desampylase [Halobiforma nitratireducens]|uniref:Mov34/MPN/PAD-1 family protein n=1 Tax=Halobiforma nitratireducens JCM 10879 TaxID=1227454 RepID=M0M9U0_9EURY|nr:desampylase [Halobiforma nitratireducens]EMA41175.1 Mov34/MPN/PAD-1 family protein [Halobiforma nitratireducens JCM 10879]